MNKLGIGSKTFLLVPFVLSLLAALLLPTGSADLIGGFEIPAAFHIALVGFLTLILTEGLKDRFPEKEFFGGAYFCPAKKPFDFGNMATRAPRSTQK